LFAFTHEGSDRQRHLVELNIGTKLLDVFHDDNAEVGARHRELKIEFYPGMPLNLSLNEPFR
jgi:hypothetical protein